MDTWCGYRLHPQVRDLRATELLSNSPISLLRISLVDCDIVIPKTPRWHHGRVELAIQHPAIQPLQIAGRIVTEQPLPQADHAALTVEWYSRERSQMVGLAQLLSHLRLNNQASGPSGPLAPMNEVHAPESGLLRLARVLAQISTRLRLRSLSGSIIASSLPPENFWPAESFSLDIETHYVDYLFVIGPSRNAGSRSVHMVRLAERSHARVPAPRGLLLSFRHPLSAEMLPVRAVAYVSHQEIAFWSDSVQDLLYPGLVLGPVELNWKGGALELEGVVGELSAAPAGLCRLLITGGLDQSRWRDEVGRICHPETVVGWREAGGLWTLLKKSGYFGIADATPERFAALYPQFVESGQALASTPTLGNRSVWRVENRIDVTCSILRLHHYGYVAYQLARAHERPMAEVGSHSLREVMTHAVRHAMGSPHFGWLIMQVKRDGPRFSRLSVEFALEHVRAADGKEGIAVVPGRVLELDTSLAPSAGKWAQDATADDLSELIDLLQGRFPSPYREALDLVSERFGLEELSADWASAGLKRTRKVLVVRSEGRLAGAAVADSVSAGLHLFGLFDTVRLYLVKDAPTPVVDELLASAALWYRSQGKSRFVWIDELCLSRPYGADVTDFGIVDQVFLRRDLVIEWLEQIASATVFVEEANERDDDWLP